MARLKIALLAGGNSSERGIALQSAQQIAAALDPGKYDVKVIDVHFREWIHTTADGRQFPLDRNDFSLTIDGEKTIFEYALIIIHGTPGEDGKLQGYLDMMDIPYSSCSQVSSTVTFDKVSTKRAVMGHGINLAKEILITRFDKVDPEQIARELGLPLFVKPNASGSSFGVTKCESVSEIEPAVKLALTESEDVLIEECIRGREVGCGVLITRHKELVLPVTEIIPKNNFFDFESKYTAGMSEEITPADIDAQTLEKLNRMTVAAYKACRCRGIVRIDFIITPEGEPYMIEINAIPGMSSGSIVPKQARCMGISLGELFDMVIEDTRR